MSTVDIIIVFYIIAGYVGSFLVGFMIGSNKGYASGFEQGVEYGAAQNAYHEEGLRVLMKHGSNPDDPSEPPTSLTQTPLRNEWGYYFAIS